MTRYRFKSQVDNRETREAKKIINYHQKHKDKIILINVAMRVDYRQYIMPIEVKNGLTLTGSIFGPVAKEADFLRRYSNKGPMKKTAVKLINELTEYCEEVTFVYTMRVPEITDVFLHEIKGV